MNIFLFSKCRFQKNTKLKWEEVNISFFEKVSQCFNLKVFEWQLILNRKRGDSIELLQYLKSVKHNQEIICRNIKTTVTPVQTYTTLQTGIHVLSLRNKKKGF